MENGVITDEQITSSSAYYAMVRASQARLYRERVDGYPGGGWLAVGINSQWLQIDFISRYSLTRVATQGQHLQLHWVTKYKLQYRDYGESFKYYKEQGQSTEKVNTFNAIL